MKNFFRVVLLSLRFRWSAIGAVGCALSIGLLWGTNIGTVFPFVEVVFGGQSLPEWIDQEIVKSDGRVSELEASIDRLRQRQAEALGVRDGSVRRSRIEERIGERERQLGIERQAAARYRRFQPLVHRYLPNRPFATLVLVVAFLFTGTLVKVLFLAASTVLTERLAQGGIVHLRKQLFAHVLALPLARLQADDSGQLISRMTYDVDQVTVGLRMLFGRTLREPLKMLACLIGAALICWRLMAFSLLIAPVAVYAISQLNRSLKRANKRALEEMSQIYSVLGDSLRGIKIIQAFTAERTERRRFDVVSRRFFRRAMRVSVYDALVRPSVEMLGIGVICIAILAGGYLVLNEQTHLLGIRISNRPLSISSIMLFFGLLAGISDPARKLSGVIARLQRAAAAADRLYEVIDQTESLPRPERTTPLPDHCREIVLENVHFAYGQGETVLRGIDLQIPAGQSVALVGSNGSGKSTLASLIPRFFDPTIGRVTIDGHDLRRVNLRTLRGQIGLVTQDPFLFNGSVEANIRLGHPTASLDDIMAAARQAHADEFIRELPDGYQTDVGENACRLSGGQKQRIALARVILRRPRILILDEATSQIDLESEHHIHQALTEFMRGRTTIIVTHRLGILELVDRVLILEEGQIADDGSYRELQRRSRLLARLTMSELPPSIRHKAAS